MSHNCGGLYFIVSSICMLSHVKARLPLHGPFVTVQPRIENEPFGAFDFPAKFSVEFEILNTTWVLEMVKNTALFHENYVVEEYFETHGPPLTTSVFSHTEHCYYHGFVRGDVESTVALSTCYGLDGLIITESEQLHIQPLHRHIEGPHGPTNVMNMSTRMNSEHIVFKVASLPPGKFCGVPHVASRRGAEDSPAQAHCFAGVCVNTGLNGRSEVSDIDADKKVPMYDKNRRVMATSASAKTVELLVVNDYDRFTVRQALFESSPANENTTENTAAIVNLASAMFKANGFEPSIDIVLIGQIVWRQPNPITAGSTSRGEVNSLELLNAFNAFHSSDAVRSVFAHDNAALFTGLDLDGQTMGLAGVCDMCTPGRSGSVSQTTQALSASSAAIFAHELGHNFCMGHDGLSNSCSRSGFLMQAVTDKGAAVPRVFSNCSKEEFGTFFTGNTDYNRAGYNLQMPSRQCLENKPTRHWYTQSVCGNGFVEDGEECDCGNSDCQGTRDPCCDGARCKLWAGSACSGMDACCTNCQVSSVGEMCRASASECDLPEVCNGQSATCPPNIFYAPGSTCMDMLDREGACFKGQCITRGGACAAIDANLAFTCPQFQHCDAFSDCCGSLVCANASAPSKCLMFPAVAVEDGAFCTGCSGDTCQCQQGTCVSSSSLQLALAWNVDRVCPCEVRCQENGNSLPDSSCSPLGIKPRPGCDSEEMQCGTDWTKALLIAGVALGVCLLVVLASICSCCGRTRLPARGPAQRERSTQAGHREGIGIEMRTVDGGDGGSIETVRAPTFWEHHVDPSTNCVYFFNSRTGESTWERPLDLQ